MVLVLLCFQPEWFNSYSIRIDGIKCLLLQYHWFTFFPSLIKHLFDQSFSMGFSISPNPIFFSMHSIGIFGFPRRISDYPVLFSRFHWLNAFGLVGVALPMFFLLSPFLFKLRRSLNSRIILFISCNWHSASKILDYSLVWVYLGL